ncbi:hypothetical protein RKE29_17490, partial [Streptomyces sp. B1866]|nr:hypothetical protein [Streptomyces sp. B1866]
ADGTCAGVPAAPRSAAATARGTARDRAPREVCVLGAPDGSPRYRLQAYFGPYAEDARSRFPRDAGYADPTPADLPAGTLGGSVYWASARCPAEAEPALFVIGPEGAARRTGPDLGYERAALRAFAHASASRHGCGTPTAP